MQAHARSLRERGAELALVPTMGCLHAGHLALMAEARRRAGHLVVSIFVNPTQFGPNEDFAAYPRDLDRDLALAREAGAESVFAPRPEDLYGPDYQTFVTLEALPRLLCGRSRPGHFRGVATVVAKLFNIVRPRVAVFGEKDFQQLQVIRRMAEDLHFDVAIVGHPTVREADGLAMSSRNAYLTAAQRPAALSLSAALRGCQAAVARGEREAAALIAAASQQILAHAENRIDYLAIVDPRTLMETARIDRPARMLMAVHVGTTRLIDNAPLEP
jgi:pantoate--beta-alanine ligase